MISWRSLPLPSRCSLGHLAGRRMCHSLRPAPLPSRDAELSHLSVVSFACFWSFLALSQSHLCASRSPLIVRVDPNLVHIEGPLAYSCVSITLPASDTEGPRFSFWARPSLFRPPFFKSYARRGASMIAPSLPIASTGQPSIASLQSASSSGVSGCL